MARALRSLLTLTIAVVRSLANNAELAKMHPSWSRGCQKNLKVMTGLQEQTLKEVDRKYMLFLPRTYRQNRSSPLWILAPGAYETAQRFLSVSGILEWAEKNQNIAFAALQSLRIEGFNVGLHARPMPDPNMPDDVAYTRAVLRDVSHNLCIDMDRIRCVGYSRGARFCSLLASELSNFIKGIAPVAGLRYPDPNNATWPMPVIALHGAADRINPYWGHGDPSYWNASVPDAVHRWAKFNKCKFNKWIKVKKTVVFHAHYDCKDDASVVLAMMAKGGHTWPGSGALQGEQFGTTTKEVQATKLIQQFFMRHPRKSHCHTTVQGESCFDAVDKAMREGVNLHPEWVGKINPASTFEDYQELMHDEILADCPKPCRGPSLFRFV